MVLFEGMMPLMTDQPFGVLPSTLYPNEVTSPVKSGFVGGSTYYNGVSLVEQVVLASPGISEV